jgi:glycosyltransferase involved in cell wall biosynthesis
MVQREFAQRSGEAASAPAPLVTLIMTAWQPEPAWLVEAVESALAQRGCEIELLLVDDGSPVPVAELVEAFDDLRLRIVRIPHGGLYRARNAGIEAARGSYLRFIDADDVIHPDSTARLLELAAGRDDVIAYGTTIRCDEQLRPVGEISSSLAGNVVTECLLSRFTVRHMSMLFPRRVVERGGPYDTTFTTSGDWDFVLRALEHAEVRGGPIVATYYRGHANQMSSNLERAEAGMELVLTRYFERHPELQGSRLRRQALAAARLKSARSYNSRGRRREAFRRVWAAARLDPGAAGRMLGGWLGRRVARLRPPQQPS